MSTTTRKQRTYDHRLRDLLQTTRDIQLASRHGVPTSTARGWLSKSAVDVVTIDVLDLDTMVSDGNMGCPHEEGEDFPDGEDCPFWKGKQGSEAEN